MRVERKLVYCIYIRALKSVVYCRCRESIFIFLIPSSSSIWPCSRLSCGPSFVKGYYAGARQISVWCILMNSPGLLLYLVQVTREIFFCCLLDFDFVVLENQTVVDLWTSCWPAASGWHLTAVLVMLVCWVLSVKVCERELKLWCGLLLGSPGGWFITS